MQIPLTLEKLFSWSTGMPSLSVDAEFAMTLWKRPPWGSKRFAMASAYGLHTQMIPTDKTSCARLKLPCVSVHAACCQRSPNFSATASAYLHPGGDASDHRVVHRV